jgi:hypothetical protein
VREATLVRSEAGPSIGIRPFLQQAPSCSHASFVEEAAVRLFLMASWTAPQSAPPCVHPAPCRGARRSRHAGSARHAFLRDLLGGGGSKSGDGSAPESASNSVSPPYTVLRRSSGYELRVYAAYVAVRTAYSTRGDGLQRLAEYLDGRGSVEGVRCVATTPVFTFYAASAEDPDTLDKHMELFVSLPPGQGKPPTPRPDSGVSLRVGGGEPLAVLPLFGNVTPEAAAAGRQQLEAALAQDGLAVLPEPGAPFRLATYGPLFSLAPRLNELMLRVQL